MSFCDLTLIMLLRKSVKHRTINKCNKSFPIRLRKLPVFRFLWKLKELCFNSSIYTCNFINKMKCPKHLKHQMMQYRGNAYMCKTQPTTRSLVLTALHDYMDYMTSGTGGHWGLSTPGMSEGVI